MRSWVACSLVLLLTAVACNEAAEEQPEPAAIAAPLTLPSGFVEEPLGAGWSQAVGLTFTADGQLMVWEKAGRVWRVQANGQREASPLIDITQEVGDWRDYGLLGFALHPNFLSNGYIYLLYAVDYHHLDKFGTPAYEPNSNQYFWDTQIRLTRYQARASDGFKSVDPASRKVLFGETKGTGCPLHHDSHGPGSLVFGSDGTLLVTCGDGASYDGRDSGGNIGGSSNTALTDGIITQAEDVGAFRAQLVNSMAGKVLRIDPATGDGVPSNPFYDPTAPRAARSRVWALGFRNPFRATLRPGTGGHDPAEGNPGTLYVGDVGWVTWEELSIVTGPGQNFGWPLFEGHTPNADYGSANAVNRDAPNPLSAPISCPAFFQFKDLIVQENNQTPTFPNPCNPSQQIPNSIPKFKHKLPAIDWMHSSNGPARYLDWQYGSALNYVVVTLGSAGSIPGTAFGGSSSTGGVWYTGTDFPPEYQNTYFHADYAGGWVKNMRFDQVTNELLEVRNFAPAGNGSVVAMATNPVSGGLYYITYAATVRRIRYTGGGNQPPVPVASSNVTYGASPLTVQFTGDQSRDPELGPLTYLWNFGDGTPTSNQANPTHTFSFGSGPQTYTVTLSVTDVAGMTRATTLNIVVNNVPPMVSVTSPVNGDVFSIDANSTEMLTASPTDSQQSDVQLSCAWQTTLHHNTHTHPEPIANGCSQTAVITPVPCDDEDYHYEFAVTVNDGAGLATTQTVSLYPDCAPGALEPLNVTASLTPTFGWRRVQGANQYEILVNDSAQQGAINTVLTAAQAGCASGPRCTFLAPSALAIGNASFQVRSRNPVAGWRGWSPVANFAVLQGDTEPPPPPPPPPPPIGSNLALLGTPMVSVANPTGGGNTNIAIIKDGIKPASGSFNEGLQYDTYTGAAAATGWVGYTFTNNYAFTHVVYQQGMNFGDGGWWDTLKVQVLQSGVWVDAPGLTITPAYTGSTTPNFATFTLAFTTTTGNGIRLFGAPGGSADFFSIAELEVYDGGATPPPPPPTNVAPVANAGADQSVTSGQTVTLNGSGSSDPNGDAITHQWTQVAQAGVPAVTLSSATAVAPSFTAPAVSSSTVLTFNLVVRDATLASVADSVAITVAPPAPPPPPPSGTNLATVGTAVISVTAPNGGGNRNLNIIKDGVKPAPGTFNDWTQYDTYTGQTTTTGWVGYTFSSSHTFNQVVFHEGMHYSDGGWWETLTVQVQQGTAWVPVTGLSIVPVYPFNNYGASYQSFTLGFTPIAGTGIRLFGQPGGSADFFSIAELEVYATGSEPPPPPPPTNTAPTANAGPDQSVQSGQTVTLNGAGSSDPEGAALAYVWSQVVQAGDPTVTLVGANGVQPVFTAPNVASARTLTFQLVVGDGSLSSAPDTVLVTVIPPPPNNLRPIANAGIDQAVQSGQTVTLDGTGSFDPDGTQVTYAWSQISTGAPTVNLSSTITAQPTFVAPTVTTSTPFAFQLTVSDGQLTSTIDTVSINVLPPPPVNNPPVANAGSDQSTTSGQLVTLNGTLSSDPNGTTVAYAWSQVIQAGDPAVTLSSATAAQPTFTAPSVASTRTLTFQLIVSDGQLSSAADTVLITVAPPAPVNQPPVANAGADQTVVSGQLVTLNGTLSSDPNGTTVTYAWSQQGTPAVTLSSATASQPTFSAPSVGASTVLTFRLQVSDGQLSSSVDTVLITVTPAPPPPPPDGSNLASLGTATVSVTSPLGGGNRNIDIIKDGIKPAVGNGSDGLQYDTYHGAGAAPTGFVGYTFTSNFNFTSLLFQEGKHYGDGGWWETLIVQVRQAGTWVPVTGLVIAPVYPFNNNGVSYQSYTLTFDTIAGDGIRLYGTPGGSADFFSIAELEVYASGSAPPPPPPPPPPNNQAPTANAGADQAVNAGATVTLNGTNSSDPEAAPLTYAWTQLGSSPAGTAVTLTGAATAQPTFTAPSVSGATTLTFGLVVNDGSLASAQDTIVVSVSPPPPPPPPPAGSNLASAGTAFISVTAPNGGGNRNIDIIKDGVKPAPGTFNDWTQYDTYTGQATAAGWVGYTFSSNFSFTHVVFQEGMSYSDGGWFDTITVQVRQGASWVPVTGLTITPAYPGNNNISYQSFTLAFTPMAGDGIRVYGAPGGSADFFSVAELEVYAAQ